MAQAKSIISPTTGAVRSLPVRLTSLTIDANGTVTYHVWQREASRSAAEGYALRCDSPADRATPHRTALRYHRDGPGAELRIARLARSLPEGGDPTIGRFISPDSVVPDYANPQDLNRYSYVLGNPVRFADPTGHFSEEELRTLLGDNYDTLWDLWSKYDQYWTTVLTELHAGDTLQASLLGNAALQFEGNGGTDIRAVVRNGDVSSSLIDWQGKGAYTVRHPGMSDEDTAGLRDTLFDRNESGIPNTVIEPVFDYERVVNGKVRPSYLGARMVQQSIGSFQYRTLLPAGFDIPVTAVLWWSKPYVGAVKLGLDMSFSIYTTYQEPKNYSTGWPGLVDINRYISRERLTD